MLPSARPPQADRRSGEISGGNEGHWLGRVTSRWRERFGAKPRVGYRLLGVQGSQ